jgi:formamidopyrimidine-DNA glycosylase
MRSRYYGRPGVHNCPVPELPEVQALALALASRSAGHRIERCELASFAALKTVDPPLDALAGRTVSGVERRGKFVCVPTTAPGDDTAELWLVVHLARGGWIRWSDALPPGRSRPTRSPLALRVRLDDGSGWDVTEMGTEKRLALWVVTAPTEVPPIAGLGVDPLDPEFTVGALDRLLAASRSTLKTLLTTQSVIAGVGNAYSDEALHRAQLSPYKRADSLDAEESRRLRDAVVGVLTEAVERSEGLGPADLKDDKRRAMQVHGRAGERCPVCGDSVREVSFASKSLQYCPTCQTGGKILADRRLSRLLK